MIRILKILTLILTIFSCKESKKEPEKNKYEILWDKQKRLDSINLKGAEELSKISNANIAWDTTERFTYSFQETIQTDSRPISFIGEIKDIIKEDSIYILKVVNTNSYSSKNYVAEIYVNSNMFQKLKSKIDPKENNEGCFIVNVTNISSHLPILKSEIESNGERTEDASSYLTLDFDGSLVKIQGKLKAFFLYDRLKEENE